MAEYELKSILEQYELLRKQLEEADKEIEELVMQVPGVREMLKTKGVGINTVAGFISEIGDIKRYDIRNRYKNLDLNTKTSGIMSSSIFWNLEK